MIPGYHDQEKFVQAHRENLLREAEHERLLAQLPQPDHSDLQLFLARSALFQRSLRARLQKWTKASQVDNETRRTVDLYSFFMAFP